MPFGCSLVVNHKKYYKGEGGGFPHVWGCGESCKFIYAHGSFVYQKCSNYALIDLFFGLCMFLHKVIIDQNVVYVYDLKIIKPLLENVVHECVKCDKCIGESKRHHQ
jgi:hypothetical protein